MEQTKENLINSLVIDLAETSNLSISELKSKIETKLYNWNCTEITNTELSVCDGSVTRELLKYFRIGKLGSNKTIDTIEQYERVALQLCDMVNKELNMITSDDVKYFLLYTNKYIRYQTRQWNQKDCTFHLYLRTCSKIRKFQIIRWIELTRFHSPTK